MTLKVQTVRKIAKELSTNGPYVLVNGQVRKKGELGGVLKMRRSTLLGLIGSGYVVINDSHVQLTDKGYRVLHSRQDEKTRSAAYAQRMRDRGCVRKNIWVHPDDIPRFNDFIATLKGPGE